MKQPKWNIAKQVVAMALVILLSTQFSVGVWGMQIEHMRIQTTPFQQPVPVDYTSEVSPEGNSSTPEEVPANSAVKSESVIESGAASAVQEENSLAGASKPDASSLEGASSALEETEKPEEPTIDTQEENLREPFIRSRVDPNEVKYGEPVETSEYSRVFSTGVDQFKTVISVIPNSFVGENGEEQPIENQLEVEDNATGTPVFENKANDTQMQLPTQAMAEEGASVSFEGTGVRLIPMEGDFSKPVSKENAVRYNDVFEGIDIQFTAEEIQLKEDIILNQQVEKNEFRYLLETDGLEAVLEEGRINLYGADKTLPVFAITAPVMSDAAGETSYKVSLALTKQDEQNIVTVTADKDWLTAPERAYPILIDPTVINNKKAAAGMLAVGSSTFDSGGGHSAAGYVEKYWLGVEDPTWNLSRTFFYFDGITDSLGADAEIDSATFEIYQYDDRSGGETVFELYMPKARRTIEDLIVHSGFSNHWEYVQATDREFAGTFTAETGKTHKIDVTEIVNNWHKGIADNFGLMLVDREENNTTLGGRFYPAEGVEPDIAPCIELNWHIVGDVPKDYGINDTTVNIHPINSTDRSGKLDYYGAFWSGMAKPDAKVAFQLNESGAGYAGNTDGSLWYQYPDRSKFPNLFPLGSTNYKRRLGNWQTPSLFYTHKYDTVYSLSATASMGGQTGASKSSDTFLIYRVKQFDTLTKIANYYGVDYNVIGRDNRVVDRLLVAGNTLFIRNPKVTTPYTPGELSDDDKTRIDNYLMGRGLHCEFGFEPVNLNTGNFYLAAVDSQLQDLTGTVQIERSYNSKGADYQSVFGKGWGFSYDESLSKCEDGSMAYRRGDGSVAYFAPNGSGGYHSPSGAFLGLTTIATGEQTVNFGTDDDPDILTYPIEEFEIKETDGTIRHFNAWGLLTAITDGNGFVTQLGYDANYNLETITAPSGKVFRVTSNPNGTIARIDLPNGTYTAYVYDGNGNLVEYTDPSGHKTGYNYDGKNRMVSWVDANNTTIITNTYDGENRVVKQVDGEGRVSQLSYAPGQTKTTDANGKATTYYYDAQYRTTKIAYADGTVESIGYDANNNRAFVEDALGHRTSYGYDAGGNMTQQTRFDGKTQKYTYNASNKVTSFTDFNGAVTTFSYNPAGDMVQLVDPKGGITQYSYNGAHNPVLVKDALGRETHFAYTGGLLTQITDVKGNNWSFGYDIMGNNTSATDPMGNISRTFYSNTGQVTGEQAPDGGYTEYIYDAGGRVVTVKDPNGYPVHFTYDKADNMLTLTDTYGQTYRWTYDGVGNQLTETDPLGNKVSFTYNAMSQRISNTNGDGFKTTYTLDALGNLLETKAPDGGITKFTYDYRHNTTTQIQDPMGGITKFEYNDNGLPVKQIFPDNTTILLEYDTIGQLAKYTDQAGLVTQYTYDVLGNVLTATDSLGRQVEYSYDEAGLPTAITLPEGVTKTFSYNKLGQVTQMVDAMGNASAITYGANGQPKTVTNANGDTIGFTYDKNGNITQQTDALGNVRKNKYDALNNLTLTVGPTGEQTKYVYDAAGRLTQTHNAFGDVAKYQVNGRGQPVQITDEMGNEYKLEYDAAGNLTEEILPDGTHTSYEYNKNNQMVRSTSPSGLVSVWEYDAMGRVIKETDNGGTSNQYEYHPSWQLAKVTDALGQATQYEYDLAGNLTSVLPPDGNKVRYSYDLNGNLLSATDAEDKTTQFTYDKNGNLLETKDPALRLWQYDYDKIGQLTKVTDPLGAATSYEYDANENLVKTTNANGGIQEYSYDPMGNLLAYKDEKGSQTSMEYDVMGRMTRQTAPDGGVYEYLYNPLGQVTMEKNPLGHITEYGYDTLGNISKLILPNRGSYSYAYNPSGQLVAETDPLGKTTRWDTDLLGRITEKELPNGATYTYAYDEIGRLTGQTGPEGAKLLYSYDPMGNLEKLEDEQGQATTYTYDPMHRLTQITDPAQGVTALAYDASNNLNGVTTPGGAVYGYTYDELNRLTAETDALGNRTNYSYDPLGNLTQVEEPTGRVSQYGYDAGNNPVSYTDTLGQAYQMSYDEMNRLVEVKDPLGASIRYTYDALGQLVETENHLGGQQAFTYDEMGNITQWKDEEGRTKDFQYDQLSQLTGTTDGTGAETAYTYDEVGNLATRTDAAGQQTNYSYNLTGNLTKTQDPAGNIWKNKYDVSGRLIGQTLPSGKTLSYDYDALDNLVHKSYNGEESEVFYYYDADGNLTSMMDGAGYSTYRYNQEGQLLRTESSTGAVVEYTYTPNGEISSITYPDGESVEYTYDELGRLTEVTGLDDALTSYTYNEQNQVVLVERTDGTATATSYDAIGQLTKLTNYSPDGKVLSAFAYTYDESGYIATEKATVGTEISTHTYRYNQRGELETATENGKTTTYTYDPAGNRIKKEGAEGTTLYTYNKAGQLAKTDEASGVTSYTWDKDGNLVQTAKGEEVYTLEYTTESRLQAVRQGGTLLVSHLYDGMGDRVGSLRYTMVEESHQVDNTVTHSWAGQEWRTQQEEWQQVNPTSREVTTTNTLPGKTVTATQGGTGAISTSQPLAEASGSGQTGQSLAPEGLANSQPVAESQPATSAEEVLYLDTASNDGVFLYGFGHGMLRLFSSFNQYMGSQLCREFQTVWMEAKPEKPFTPQTFTPETKTDLEKQGYTPKDIALMEKAGLTQQDAEQVANPQPIKTVRVGQTGTPGQQVTDKTTVTGSEVVTHTVEDRYTVDVTYTEEETQTQIYREDVPTYDVVYYANDILAEDTQLLAEASKLAGDTSYTYGEQRLYAQGTQHAYETEDTQSTYLYDGKGSVTQVLQELEVVQTLKYSEYGEPASNGTSPYQSFFGYNGEEHDNLTGLQYLRARYYSPGLGQFATKDSFAGVLTEALSQNSYTYGHNNPVNYSDPSGHAAKRAISPPKPQPRPVSKREAQKTEYLSRKAAVNRKAAQNALKNSYSKAVSKLGGTNYSKANSVGAGNGALGSPRGKMKNVVSYQQITRTNAKGEQVLLPAHFENVKMAANEFVRMFCDPNARRVQKSSNTKTIDSLITDFLEKKGAKTAEIAIVKKDPLLGYHTFVAKTTAERVELIRWGQVVGGSQENAFRHAYWSGQIAFSAGAKRASQITTAHEQQNANVVISDGLHADKAMDLHNNEIGIRIGTEVRNSSHVEINQYLIEKLGSAAVINEAIEEYSFVDEYDLALMLQIDDVYRNALEAKYENGQLVATNGKDIEGQLVFIN